jgi:Restriction endonuclease
MTSGKRNRQAGHKFELVCVSAFKEAGFSDVVSSRSSNRNRDAQKIDLVNRDEIKSGRLPWAVQCKNVKGHLRYAAVLSELPDEEGITKVVLHNQTEKVGDRFVTRDRFAILYMEDFMAIVRRLKEYEQTATGGQLVSNPGTGNEQTILPPSKGRAKARIQQ